MAIDLVNLLELVASVWGGSPELEKVELNLSHYLHYNNLTTADIKDKLEAQFGVGMAKQHSHSQAVPPASMGPEKTHRHSVRHRSDNYCRLRINNYPF